MNEGVSRLRKARRESSLLKVISGLLMTLSVEEPLLKAVFCTRVSLSPDCSKVVVFLQSHESEEVVRNAIEVLKLYRPSMRTSLARLVALRHTPDIRFFYDENYEKQKRIETLLDAVKKLDQE